MKKILITLATITALYFYFNMAVSSQKTAELETMLSKNISIELKKEKLNTWITNNPELKEDANKIASTFGI